MVNSYIFSLSNTIKKILPNLPIEGNPSECKYHIDYFIGILMKGKCKLGIEYYKKVKKKRNNSNVQINNLEL